MAASRLCTTSFLLSLVRKSQNADPMPRFFRRFDLEIQVGRFVNFDDRNIQDALAEVRPARQRCFFDDLAGLICRTVPNSWTDFTSNFGLSHYT
jgi:hypothetical protein